MGCGAAAGGVAVVGAATTEEKVMFIGIRMAGVTTSVAGGVTGALVKLRDGVLIAVSISLAGLTAPCDVVTARVGAAATMLAIGLVSVAFVTAIAVDAGNANAPLAEADAATGGITAIAPGADTGGALAGLIAAALIGDTLTGPVMPRAVGVETLNAAGKMAACP